MLVKKKKKRERGKKGGKKKAESKNKRHTQFGKKKLLNVMMNKRLKIFSEVVTNIEGAIVLCCTHMDFPSSAMVLARV